MLTLSKHTATVYSSSGMTYFTPTTLDVTIDETWSPYIQASITLPSAMLTEELDPREEARLIVRMHQAFGDLLEITALTTEFGGDIATITAYYAPDITPKEFTDEFTTPWNMFEPADPISAITAAYDGDVSDLTAAFAGDVSDVSKFLHTEGGSFNPAPSTFIEADLGIRGIERDLLTGETRLQLSSDEALLQDGALTSTSPYVPAYTDVRTLVAYVLGSIGASLQAGSDTGTFTAAEWTPGQSGWDFVNPIVQKAGLVLYCDEARRWYLVQATAVTGEINLKDTDNITQLTTSLHRNENYFDSCIIEYNWLNVSGETQRQWDVYAPSGSTRTQHIKLDDTPYPGVGYAQELTERALTRGETFDIQAISNYFARPRQTITVDVIGEPLKSAITSSIRWSMPNDIMAITVRDLQEII